MCPLLLDHYIIQCASCKDHQIFGDHLEELVQKEKLIYKRCFSSAEECDHKGFLNVEIVQKWLAQYDFNASNSQVYFCGPKPFMATLNKVFVEIGFDAANIHYEVFGPTIGLPEQ